MNRKIFCAESDSATDNQSDIEIHKNEKKNTEYKLSQDMSLNCSDSEQILSDKSPFHIIWDEKKIN